MNKSSKFIVSLVAASVLSFGAFAKPVVVGGAPMYADKTIAQNAPNAKNLTTLVAAVKAAGLVDTLASKGPFTVFAPTNSAFKKLPAGTVDTLLKPENKAKLTGVLTYHVVSGTYTTKKIKGRHQEGRRRPEPHHRRGRADHHQDVEGQARRHRPVGWLVGDPDRRRPAVERRRAGRRQRASAEELIGSARPKLRAAQRRSADRSRPDASFSRPAGARLTC